MAMITAIPARLIRFPDMFLFPIGFESLFARQCPANRFFIALSKFASCSAAGLERAGHLTRTVLPGEPAAARGPNHPGRDGPGNASPAEAYCVAAEKMRILNYTHVTPSARGGTRTPQKGPYNIMLVVKAAKSTIISETDT